jgi:hypothetical protein
MHFVRSLHGPMRSFIPIPIIFIRAEDIEKPDAWFGAETTSLLFKRT